MSTITTEIFGIDEVSFNAPSTVAEIISLCDEARVLELIFQGAMPSNANKVKAAFVKKLEEVTGEKRFEKDGKVTESQAAYVARVKEIFGEDFTPKFRPVLEEIMAAHVFSFNRERAAVAEVKVPKRYITTVMFMHENGKLEAAIAKYAPEVDFASLLDGEELTADGAVEAARLLRAPLEKREKELEAQKANI